jgi:sulfoxide reductase heme-binding subunit YedZ
VTTAPVVWYAMRATGVVAMLLLTVSVALGIATSNRWRPRGSRLYVTTAIHRHASLLAVVFLALHVVTAVADRDAAVSLAAVFGPSSSLGLTAGALSLDLVAALSVTSLLRRHLAYGTWRAIHWSAYGAWPLALAHGLALGSDNGTWWADGSTVACIAAAAGALVWRLLDAAEPAAR